MSGKLKSKWSALDEMRSIALEGLHYAKDPYDIARYQRLCSLVEQEYTELTQLSIEQIQALFKKEMGIQTPKLGVGGVVFDGNNKALILKRSDDSRWCNPCGWVDVGESPRDAMIRELYEETGLELEPLACIAAHAQGPGFDSHMTHQVGIRFIFKTEQANIKISHEHLDYKWISEAEMGDVVWHYHHDLIIKWGYEFLKTGQFNQRSLF